MIAQFFKDYQVVSGFGTGELEEAVKQALSEGWRLQGGVCAYPDASMTRFYQAMVRDSEEV